MIIRLDIPKLCLDLYALPTGVIERDQDVLCATREFDVDDYSHQSNISDRMVEVKADFLALEPTLLAQSVHVRSSEFVPLKPSWRCVEVAFRVDLVLPGRVGNASIHIMLPVP